MPLSREDFFSIMSAFPTGVAIVTTLDANDEPKGLTTNAICSVSAEPPLLLVCVDSTSRTLPALRHSQRFVVNFMSDGAAELCARFASKAEDKFDGVPWEPGLAGMPLLADHVIFVGLVESGRPPDPDSVPILYYRRSYGSIWTAAS